MLIFFTYLYATTVLGVEVNPARSVLVPTAHDEPAIRLEIYKDVFGKPAAIMFNTEIERQFLKEQFARLPSLEETVGVGVDIPQHQPYPRMPAAVERVGERRGRGRRRRDAAVREFPSHLTARGAVFRRRHRLYGPFALYGGRIDPGKGCEELIEYFSRYVKGGGDATLALMGVKLMALPEEPFINFAGLLSDRERLQALEAATVVICPSPYESLSLLALEALSVGTPILVNGRSPVLVEHCGQQQRRSVLRGRRRIRRMPEAARAGRPPSRRDGPQRPRVRPAQLPLGRRAGEIRTGVREDQKRQVTHESGNWVSW